ncbi:MAG: hypothetical protein KDA37_17240 [Planctomycetales bacterium]|nr:hypothetical protein [Planctomycetales bacterium]
MDEARQKFVLAEEPADVQTVLDLIDRPEGFESGPVTLVGKVGGMPNPWTDQEPAFPWKEGQASFFLVDPATAASFADHEHAAGEDHSDCIFCQQRAKQSASSIAAVTFNDPVGHPYPLRADKLLGVAENDVVVVTGEAKKLGDLLVVNATGIYVRK